MSRLGTFELMRVWAAITGIALALGYFATAWLDMPLPSLALLVTAIGGFEIGLTGQDVLLQRQRRHG